MHIVRRTPMLLLSLLLAACAAPLTAPSAPPSVGMVEVTLIKSPTCACCTGHEAYLRDHGWSLRVDVTEDVEAVKDAERIPLEMRSCHTSIVAGYFVEGHVPMSAIEKLLAERPDLDGIALPGMPAGAPGMTGTSDGPLTVYGIRDGTVVGVFGDF